ncbi:MAG: hypothetical protein RIB58_01525 [Phycisphaerales bacterium]
MAAKSSSVVMRSSAARAMSRCVCCSRPSRRRARTRPAREPGSVCSRQAASRSLWNARVQASTVFIRAVLESSSSLQAGIVVAGGIICWMSVVLASITGSLLVRRDEYVRADTRVLSP